MLTMPQQHKLHQSLPSSVQDLHGTLTGLVCRAYTGHLEMYSSLQHKGLTVLYLLPNRQQSYGPSCRALQPCCTSCRGTGRQA